MARRLAMAALAAAVVVSNVTLLTPNRAAAAGPSASFNGSKNRLIQRVSLQSSSTSPRGYMTIYDDYVTLAANSSMVMSKMETINSSFDFMPLQGLVWTVTQTGESSGEPFYQLQAHSTMTCLAVGNDEDRGYVVQGERCTATAVSQQWRLVTYMATYGSVMFFEIQHVSMGSFLTPWCVRVPFTVSGFLTGFLHECSRGRAGPTAQTYFVLVPLPF